MRLGFLMRETGIDKRNQQFRVTSALALALLALAMLGFANPVAADGALRGGLTIPVPTVKPDVARIVPLARTELGKRVAERRSDNVPRYRNGKGRIVPYSIGAAWCVAFSTWIWAKAGFVDYLGTSLLRRSFDRSLVAIQVKDLTRWAKKNDFWSYRAEPGHLVLYGSQHIGIVERINRDGRAVGSIEGNKGDRVRRVRIDMSKVTGYISPVPILDDDFIAKTSSLADVD